MVNLVMSMMLIFATLGLGLGAVWPHRFEAVVPSLERAVTKVHLDENHQSRDQQLAEFSFTQLQMAMPMRITVWCESKQHAESACKLAFDRASMLVMIFSDYDQSSETRRLARTSVGQPTKVSKHLLSVLNFSNSLNQTSHGALDPTSSRVIGLWRTARKTGKLPDPNLINSLRQQCGFEKLQIDIEHGTVTTLSEGLTMDFGGIAKGYIGDQVIASLRENGIDSACYEAGGDIVLSGRPPNSNGWVIDLGTENDGTPRTIELENCGVSTSGDSQQFVELDGKRYSHVVDPRTGFGVTTGQTAFVVAPSGMQSDSLATAGCVLREAEFQRVIDCYEDTTGWIEQNSFGD